MKNNITKSVLILLLCIGYNAFAQWKPVKSLSGGESRFVCKDGSNLYLLVDNFGIAKSIDSGSTWNRILERAIPFYGTFSYMSTDGNLLAFDSLISTDTGKTWLTLNLPLSSKYSYPFFEVFHGNIYYVNNSRIAISSDSGVTWKKHKIPNYSSLNRPNRLFKSEDKLYLIRDLKIIYSTNDDGITWDSLCPTPISFPYVVKYFCTKGDTFIYSSHYASYISTNHGINWNLITKTINGCPVYFENDTMYFASNDTILYSPDLGNSWDTIASYKYSRSSNLVKIGSSILSSAFTLGCCKLDLITGQITESANGIYALPICAMENSHDSIFILTYRNTMYYSYNNGNTWSHINLQYSCNNVHYFNSALYLSVYQNSGIFKLDLTNFNIFYMGSTGNQVWDDFFVDSTGIYGYGYGFLSKLPIQGGGLATLVSYQISNASIYGNQLYAYYNDTIKVSPLQPVVSWTTITNGLNFGQYAYLQFSNNSEHLYLRLKNEIYWFDQINSFWNPTNVNCKFMYKLTGYNNAMFVSTAKQGIMVLKSDTSPWQKINFGLPKCNYDSNRIYGFKDLICTDSKIFAKSSYFPGYGLWYRQLDEIVPIVTAQQELVRESGDFEVYPNPITNFNFKVSFQFTSNIQNDLEIFDMNGKSVFKMSIPKSNKSCSINLPHLASGIYECVISTIDIRMSKKISIVN